MLTQYLTIGTCSIGLQSNSKKVRAYWTWLFADWLQARSETPVDATLRVDVTETIDPPPEGEPFFVDRRTDILEAYHLGSQRVLLHFFQGGLFEISADKRTVTGTIVENIFDTGVIDDITLVTLSSFLRTQGIYTLHASGATYQGKAVLFVGQSFSGKTTTSLNLALNGWDLLANDVVLVQRVADQIVALPLPDIISLRPKTLELLPQIQSHFEELPTSEVTLHTGQLTAHRWADPAPVAAICFPKIGKTAQNHLTGQPKTIALARLLEESLDTWDTEALAQHTRFLSELSMQADSYAVTLGWDVQAFPEWFALELFGV